MEKRYRTNLNEKIILLHDSVPSLQVVTEGEILDQDEDERDPTKIRGKAVILIRAAEFVTYLENCAECLGDVETHVSRRLSRDSGRGPSGAQEEPLVCPANL